MNIPTSILATYGLLAAAIVSLWLPSLRLNGRYTLPPWMVLFACACAIGLASGLLRPAGVLALLAFAALAHGARTREPGWFKVVLMIATACMTLALSLHLFPGFVNPPVVSNMRLGAAAAPFTHRLNFDTASAGLLLFAAFCVPARARADWRKVGRQLPVILGTPLAILAAGTMLGYVRLDPKWTAYTLVFLSCNLLFTCVTEEAFFRGFIQEKLGSATRRWDASGWIALVVAALLFGIAHARGGVALIGLASLAGLGYGYAYLRSGRIEAAILTHFALNALHFVAFTYPRAM